MSVSLENLLRTAGRDAEGLSPALTQLLAFGVVGVVAAAGYVVLSSALIALGTGVPDWIVSTLCYALFIVPAYLGHRRFSFASETPHGVALPRYIAVQLSALLLAGFFSILFYSFFGFSSFVAGPLVIVLTSGVNFVLLKLWAFAVPNPDAPLSALKLPNPFRLLNSLHGATVFGRRVRVLARHLANAIPTGGRVLDLGSGDGSIAKELMALRPDLRMEGVDVMLRPTSHIPVRLYDGKRLPYNDRSVDYVTIVDVLHHTDDPAAVLAEAARVARFGVIVKDHLLEGPLAGETLRFMDWVGNRGHNVVLPYNYLSRPAWTAAFNAARVKPASFDTSLGIYPAPFTWLFDRGLHFVARLTPGRF
jgi:putative flippase GtrA/SAM-dependent methyltransferase